MPSLIHSFFVSDTVELAFQLAELNGNCYGDIRQFFHSERYTGPTKRGLFLRRSQLMELMSLFAQNKHLILDSKTEECLGRVPYKHNSSAVVSLVESTLDNNPVCIDVREYVESCAYTGFTKKGFRLTIGQVDDLLEGFKLLIDHMDGKRTT